MTKCLTFNTKMDFSNLKGMLGTTDTTDLSDDDLEEELNAIISGQPITARPKQTTSSSVTNKRIKQNESKQSLNEMKSKTNKKSMDNQNDFKISNHLMNIDKLGTFEDINDDNDDEDIDEDNEDLLSEINSIVSDQSSRNRVNKSPEIDYEIQTIDEMKSYRSEEKILNSQLIHSNKIKDNFEDRNKPSIRDNISGISSLNANKSTTYERTESQTIGPNVITTNEIQITTKKSEIPRLMTLRDDYKRSALMAKQSGQQTNALSHIKTAKQIEVLIKALEDGLSVDLSQLPPSPLLPSSTVSKSGLQSSSTSTQSISQTNTTQENSFEIDSENIEMTSEETKTLFKPPPPPNTVMEALNQRLTKFSSTFEDAKKENNSSKARRLERIIRQYENAIKDFKKGKTVDFDALPTPPGFGPIPSATPTMSGVAVAKPLADNSKQRPEAPKTAPKPTIATNITTNANKSSKSSEQQIPKNTIESNEPKSGQKTILKRASSTANKQLNYLLERQRLFKEAALESKHRGDIQQAKEYLRLSKGFDPLIEATQNGLPIDATSIPTPPQISDDFVVVSLPESSDVNDLEKEEMFRKVEIELQNQISMCKRNKDYFMQLGDISTASKFEKYAVDSRKDMDMLTVRWRTGKKVPNFKYETRTFSIVICNTDVGTNEVSVEVINALDIQAKSDVDTYVKIEFPFPNDNTQTNRTKTVKNSINPVFNETFKFEIDRKSRQLPRVFKRHPLKLELISKGGFLRSDSVIGTALIKLVDFETKCTIHDTFGLTEGRKAIGGRIEAKVRIREPLLAKQVEEVKEKWLIFV